MSVVQVSVDVDPASFEPDFTGTHITVFERVRTREDGTHVVDSVKVFVQWDGEPVKEATVMPFPTKANYRSRTEGLIEGSGLENKTVFILGVGSGGSAVAIEMAKNGVGTIIMLDPDRLEVYNITRHVCDLTDVARFKTHALADRLRAINPFINIYTYELDFNDYDLFPAQVKERLTNVDIVVCAADDATAQQNANRFCLAHKITCLYASVESRAYCGWALRVRAGGEDPCFSCLNGEGILTADPEIANVSAAVARTPAYTSVEDAEKMVQPGLSVDILPVSTMLCKLALYELSRQKTIEEGNEFEGEFEGAGSYYMWVSRREKKFSGLAPFCKVKEVSVMRWIPVVHHHRPDCFACNANQEVPEAVIATLADKYRDDACAGPTAECELQQGESALSEAA